MRGMWSQVMLRVRLYRPDRNPLRRRSDRIEALSLALSVLLFTVGLVLAPVFGHMVYDEGVRAERSGHWVAARLEQDAPAFTLVAYEGTGGLPRVKATWTGADGRPVTRQVPVAWGAKAGTVTRVWMNESGQVADPPRRDETVARAVAVGLVAALLTGGVAAAAHATVRGLLNRHRYADWASAWLTADQRWRRRRQT
ncbi:hypothetical protein AB0K60_08200 [Thermopolyspora sp. NPDC052614]|uniref:Rv1733c family protein n=1 Tax=Thermopolyspora sp. NPDC052614 TaxID=3155682 RepID=UPI0034197912